MLHLGPVVASDPRRDGGIRHQPIDPRRSQDVRGVLLQGLVVPDHAVVDLAGRAQLGERHPVDDVIAELPVHAPPAFRVAQVADEVLEVQAGGGEVALPVAPAVFPYDGRGDVVLVPRLEAGVLYEFVLEGRNQSLEGVSYDEKLEVSV